MFFYLHNKLRSCSEKFPSQCQQSQSLHTNWERKRAVTEISKRKNDVSFFSSLSVLFFLISLLCNYISVRLQGFLELVSLNAARSVANTCSIRELTLMLEVASMLWPEEVILSDSSRVQPSSHTVCNVAAQLTECLKLIQKFALQMTALLP